MSEAEKRRNKEHKEINSEVKMEPKVTNILEIYFDKIGIELAPLIMDKVTGKPKRDPSTGYMMNHRLGTTDVNQG